MPLNSEWVFIGKVAMKADLSHTNISQWIVIFCQQIMDANDI